MNDLTVLPNDQLELMVQDIEKRVEFYKTKGGQLKGADDFLKVFSILESYGYHMKDDDKRMKAMVWFRSLRDCVETYGMKGVQEAVLEFADNDTRQFRTFPFPADIREVMKKRGSNPKAELARREAKKREDELIAKWNREIEERMKEKHE